MEDTSEDKKGSGGGILAAVISAIPAIYQIIQGASDKRKAKKIEEQNPRPTATIMDSINQLVNFNYGRMQAQDIPGGEMYRNEIKGATASGIRAASQLGKGSEAFGALGQMVSGEQRNFAEMGKLTAQQVYGAGGDYANSLLTKANAEQGAWDWNTGNKYLQAAQMASQLRGAGSVNMFSGASNLAGVGAEYASPGFNSALYGYGGSGNYGNKGGYGKGQAVFSEDDVKRIVKENMPDKYKTFYTADEAKNYG
jgi:hypothetical protein